MPAGDYIEGYALFAAMLAGTIGGAAWIAAARFGVLRGVERVLAVAVLASAAILAVHLLPMVLGVLSEASVLIATAFWIGAAALLARRGPAAARGAGVADIETPLAAGRFAAAVAGACLGVAAAFLLTSLGDRLVAAPLSIDVLNFHLPNVVRWIESGSIWQIDVFLPDVAPGHYPHNGDVLLLASVLPWRDDFLAHLVLYPYWALAGVATYALGRRLGAAPLAAARRRGRFAPGPGDRRPGPQRGARRRADAVRLRRRAHLPAPPPRRRRDP